MDAPRITDPEELTELAVESCLDLYVTEERPHTPDEIASKAGQLFGDIVDALWRGARQGLVESVPGTGRMALWSPTKALLRSELDAWRNGVKGP